MLAAAAQALAGLSEASIPGTPVLPPVTSLRAVSAAVAAAVARAAQDEGLAGVPQVDKFDAAAPPGAPLPLGRLVAEFGVRSFQTLHEWAQWAKQHIGPPA
jgi:hypothetical protein